MNRSRNVISILIVTGALLTAGSFRSTAQTEILSLPFRSPDPAQRAFDSLVASRIPVLPPRQLYPDHLLPVSLDNSDYKWFPGILYQQQYFACQQFAGIAYTFAYEINRLRDADGKTLPHKYAPHYTWHFFNEGERYVGVNFLHSFHALMEQGQMSNMDFGNDTILLERGWINGYEKYYRAMQNRIRQVWAIPVNSAEGIQTVKQYLYDHLDGSPSGGVACFTASSPVAPPKLPPGTPEAGKSVQLSWLPNPVHGMTIVGYNDSIRYDLNEDGQYTNHIDINNDSVVDARDWEIGGFLLANSYGTWWADTGYFYVLYNAMACEFEHGGVWNNCVYIVEADPDYSPLLTLKVSVSHTVRNQLNFLAGVSADPNAGYPDHLLDFPYFTFQGGPYYMQGFEDFHEQKNLEFGLDVTPLLSYVNPGSPARFFLLIEERDPLDAGEGELIQASFLNYGTQISEFACDESGIPIRNNGITLVAATGTVPVNKPAIAPDHLPPFVPGEPYAVQFSASGGTPPCRWIMSRSWTETVSPDPYVPVTDQKLLIHSGGIPLATVALPFPFPFYGKSYDTAYMNLYGMIQFQPDHIPYPFLCSSQDMLEYLAVIAPAFAPVWVPRSQDGDGMWVRSTPDSVVFRWKLSLVSVEAASNAEFCLILYPDGSFTTCYGPVETAGFSFLPYAGVSAGDKLNADVHPVFSLQAESGHSYHFRPGTPIGSLEMTAGGLLTASGLDSARISEVTVGVTDRMGICTEQLFQLSDGLQIRTELVSTSGHFRYDEPAFLNLILTNTGTDPLTGLDLRFSCTQEALEITDSTVSVIQVPAGDSAEAGQAFSFRISQVLPDLTPFPCRILASFAGSTREYDFCLKAEAPDIVIRDESLEDGVNGLLDPGETASLAFSVANMGSIPAEDLTISLSSQSPQVEILSQAQFQVPGIAAKRSLDVLFMVRASRSASTGDTANLTLTITGGPEVNRVHPVTLLLGTHPVAVITLATVSSTPAAITAVLDSLGVKYDQFTSIPPELNLYPVAFLILGTSWPGSVTLDAGETVQLTSYLAHGGNVYMESYSSWYYGISEPLEQFFSYSSEHVSVYTFNETSGVPGSFADGMSFLHLGPSPYGVFRIYPEEDGFCLFANPDADPRCLEFAHAGEGYRTIGTFLEFGKLVDGDPPSRKAILLKEYLSFFQLNYENPFPFFHADSTHICRSHSVQFTDDSFDNIISRQWEFPGGIPASSAEQNPSVSYPEK